LDRSRWAWNGHPCGEGEDICDVLMSGAVVGFGGVRHGQESALRLPRVRFLVGLDQVLDKYAHPGIQGWAKLEVAHKLRALVLDIMFGSKKRAG
jgi:hypothetical protein